MCDSQRQFVLINRFDTTNGCETVFEYEESQTGLRHIHVQSRFPDHFCLIGFCTPAFDDTGVFHALEHLLLTSPIRTIGCPKSVLALSRQMRIQYVNGTTSTDLSHYAFCARCSDTFLQFLDYTMVALFSPQFIEEDFQRELFRIESENPLKVRDAVVLNEMRAALEASARVVLEAVKKGIFAGSSSQHNSGGEPAKLYQLSLDDIEAAHRQFYTPSNCVVLTLAQGDGQEFHANILINLDGPTESGKRYETTKPKNLSDLGDKLPQQHHSDKISAINHSLSWALPMVQTFQERVTFDLIYQLLINDSTSILRQALNKGKGRFRLSNGSGYQAMMPVPVLLINCESTDENSLHSIRKIVFDSLENLSSTGFESNAIESALDYIELKYHDIFSQRLPYGFNKLLPMLQLLMYGQVFHEIAQFDSVFDKLRQKAQSPGYLEAEVRRHLLTSNNCLTLQIMPVDITLPHLPIKVNPQSSLANPESKIHRQNYFELPNIFSAMESFYIGQTPKKLPMLSIYSEDCGNVCHHLTLSNLTELSPIEMSLLPYYAMMFPHFGTCDSAAELVQQHKIQSCSLFTSSLVIFDDIKESEVNVYFQVYGKFLARKTTDYIKMREHYLDKINFSDYNRIRLLFESIYKQRINALNANGPGFVISQAESGFSAAAHLKNKLTGLAGFKKLKEIVLKLRQGQHKDIVDAIATLHQKMKNGDTTAMLIVSPSNEAEVIEQCIDKYVDEFSESVIQSLSYPFKKHTVRQWWVTDSNVQSCAISYFSANSGWQANWFELLAEIINGEYVAPLVRDNNGAYHVGAVQNRQNSAFSLFSSKSQDVEADIRLLTNAIEWFCKCFEDEEKFTRYHSKWRLSCQSTLDIPNEQVKHFVEELAVSAGELSNTFNQQAATLSGLRTLVKEQLLPQQFNCVVSAKNVSDSFVIEYQLAQYNITSKELAA